ncbi:hypothetical protein M426DRAFT_25102 [Hypoxylon sp. CI-4A]|nr:hypothetical protein M426DRAFT_25102 [Hypoxylon sp. CI-4A]
MVYIMEFKVNGIYRDGRYGPVAAAAACHLGRDRRVRQTRTEEVGDLLHPERHRHPTSQRAEMAAVIMALEWAFELYDDLRSYPRLSVVIRTDSHYAVGCMTHLVDRWVANGWINARGREVANRDILEKAKKYSDLLARLGSVTFEYIPREANREPEVETVELLDQLDNDYSYWFE